MGNDGGTVATQRKYSRWATKKEEAHVDSEEVIQKRLCNSKLEISRWREYSYLLINDDFAGAVEKFDSLLLAFRMSTKRWKEDVNG